MAEFVDEVRISVHAGSGGDGAASFLRDKHTPHGGPNGGDGGRGGSIVLRASTSLASLAPYMRRRKHRAADGGNGGPHTRKGADGGDLLLDVPVGTVVREVPTKEVVADLAREGADYIAARGGRGGRGNASLRSSRDRVPNYAEQGEPGEAHELILELHLVADVGLLGPPNAGKSTLLGAISRADPKIGAYPFTTLEPGLGVVENDGRRFVVADLPGLIEGAAEGKGLGLRFLRHAERCGVLAIVVDLAAGTARQDLEAVRTEVASYDATLVERMRVVFGNKTDLPDADPAGAEAWAKEQGARFVPISAALGSNLDDVRALLAEEVSRAAAERGSPESFVVFRPMIADRIEVSREDDAFRVRSERVERLVAQTPLGNARAVRHLQRRLAAMGVEAALLREGVKEGDEVRIGGVAFDYISDA